MAPSSFLALVEEISKSIGGLTRRLIERVGPAAVPEQFRAPHYLCLRGAASPSPALLSRLADERIYVSVRGASIRVTPHVYNSTHDVDRLAEVLLRL